MRSNNHEIKIDSLRLNQILVHWCEIRGNRLMPSWQEIRPAMIKAALPITWSYRYDAEQDEFLGGFSGDGIQRLVGGPIKNARFRQVHNAEPHFFARAKRVLFEPAAFCGRGLLFRQPERQCYGERVILPFSDGAGCAEGIIGATDYKFSLLYKFGTELNGEVEQWLDLRGPPSVRSARSAENDRCTPVVDARTP
jgi:hypothetical protein